MQRAELDEPMRRATDLAVRQVEAGGLPFAALVADAPGRILACGVNRVREDYDPTAHAEVVAIRAAAAQLSAPALTGATLIASGEPCGLCYLTARLAGVQRVAFAVDRDAAAAAGFDYRDTYRWLDRDPRQWPMEVIQVATDDAWRPFELARQRL